MEPASHQASELTAKEAHRALFGRSSSMRRSRSSSSSRMLQPAASSARTIARESAVGAASPAREMAASEGGKALGASSPDKSMPVSASSSAIRVSSKPGAALLRRQPKPNRQHGEPMLELSMNVGRFSGAHDCATKRKPPARDGAESTSDRWRLFGPAESGCDRGLNARGHPDVVNRRAADPEPPRDL